MVPGDSSRAQESSPNVGRSLNSLGWVTFSPLKGSREITIPKGSRLQHLDKATKKKTAKTFPKILRFHASKNCRNHNAPWRTGVRMSSLPNLYPTNNHLFQPLFFQDAHLECSWCTTMLAVAIMWVPRIFSFSSRSLARSSWLQFSTNGWVSCWCPRKMQHTPRAHPRQSPRQLWKESLHGLLVEV